MSQEPAAPNTALPRLAPLLGPTSAASLLVGAACATGVLGTWAAWHRYSVGMDYVAALPGVRIADLTSANATGDATGTVYLVAMMSAGLALLVWFGRVRANLRLLGGAHPPHSRWALGGWFASTAVAFVVTLLLGRATWVDDVRQLAMVDTASVALQCVAGAFVVVVVRQVTRAQWVPRADTDK
jgi:hypothetical protein